MDISVKSNNFVALILNINFIKYKFVMCRMYKLCKYGKITKVRFFAFKNNIYYQTKIVKQIMQKSVFFKQNEILEAKVDRFCFF
jgi:hypothetical protein